MLSAGTPDAALESRSGGSKPRLKSHSEVVMVRVPATCDKCDKVPTSSTALKPIFQKIGVKGNKKGSATKLLMRWSLKTLNMQLFSDTATVDVTLHSAASFLETNSTNPM